MVKLFNIAHFGLLCRSLSAENEFKNQDIASANI